ENIGAARSAGERERPRRRISHLVRRVGGERRAEPDAIPPLGNPTVRERFRDRGARRNRPRQMIAPTESPPERNRPHNGDRNDGGDREKRRHRTKPHDRSISSRRDLSMLCYG